MNYLNNTFQAETSQNSTSMNRQKGSNFSHKKKRLSSILFKNVKVIMSSFVLLLLLLGSGAGLYLSQYTQQDIRQQAYGEPKEEDKEDGKCYFGISACPTGTVSSSSCSTSSCPSGSAVCCKTPARVPVDNCDKGLNYCNASNDKQVYICQTNSTTGDKNYVAQNCATNKYCPAGSKTCINDPSIIPPTPTPDPNDPTASCSQLGAKCCSDSRDRSVYCGGGLITNSDNPSSCRCRLPYNECTPNEKSCDGKTVLYCTSQGKWTETLTCDLRCEAGSCVKNLANGKSCQSNTECSSGICKDKVCVDSQTAVSTAYCKELCYADGNTATECANLPACPEEIGPITACTGKTTGTTCVQNGKVGACTSTGTCKIYPDKVAIGGVCNTNPYNKTCVTGYECKSNKCQKIVEVAEVIVQGELREGEICSSNSQCKSNNCVRGLCEYTYTNSYDTEALEEVEINTYANTSELCTGTSAECAAKAQEVYAEVKRTGEPTCIVNYQIQRPGSSRSQAEKYCEDAAEGALAVAAVVTGAAAYAPVTSAITTGSQYAVAYATSTAYQVGGWALANTGTAGLTGLTASGVLTAQQVIQNPTTATVVRGLLTATEAVGVVKSAQACAINQASLECALGATGFITGAVDFSIVDEKIVNPTLSRTGSAITNSWDNLISNNLVPENSVTTSLTQVSANGNNLTYQKYIDDLNLPFQESALKNPQLLKPVESETITLYKGISNYDGGDILPGGLAKTANPGFKAGSGNVSQASDTEVIKHALLGLTNNSPYQSWTPNIEIAEAYAQGGAVVSKTFNTADVINIQASIPDLDFNTAFETFASQGASVDKVQMVVGNNIMNSYNGNHLEYLFEGTIPANEVSIVNQLLNN